MGLVRGRVEATGLPGQVSRLVGPGRAGRPAWAWGRSRLPWATPCSCAPCTVQLADLETLKQSSRLVHYCATPLLFDSAFRQQIQADQQAKLEGKVSNSPSGGCAVMGPILPELQPCPREGASFPRAGGGALPQLCRVRPLGQKALGAVQPDNSCVPALGGSS